MGGTEGVFFQKGQSKRVKGDVGVEGEAQEGEAGLNAYADANANAEEGGSDSSDDEYYEKIKLTAEERAVLKEEERTARKANKTEVKASQAEKREVKMKKKDKKRAISKTKGKKR